MATQSELDEMAQSMVEHVRNHNILAALNAEVVGQKDGKSIVRVYTDDKGWQYEKVSDDTALDAFASKVKAPTASRANLKVGK